MEKDALELAVQNLLSNFDAYARFKLYIVLSSDSSIQDDVAILQNCGVPALNIGRLAAEKIQEIRTTEHLAILAKEVIENFVLSNARIVNGGRKAIALYNFGILLEPDLGLNAGQVITDLSKRFIILLLWSGFYADNGILSWTSGGDDAALDVRGASPQILNLNHEV